METVGDPGASTYKSTPIDDPGIIDLVERLLKCPEISEMSAAKSIRVVPSFKIVPDAPIRFVVMNSSKRPVGFGLCSTPSARGFVGRAVRKAMEARAVLPSDLAESVLLPVSTGLLDERSFAIYPCLRTFREGRVLGRVHRMWIRTRVMRWLHEMVAATRHEADPSDARRSCELIRDFPGMDRQVMCLADDALEAIDTRSWTPVGCLSHMDFWSGNVLPDAPHRNATYPFRIIDWGGSTTSGSPGYDLVRGLESFQFSAGSWAWHAAHHASRAGMESVTHLGYQLVASLGQIAAKIEEFPVDRFRSLAQRSVRNLASLQTSSTKES